MSEVVVDDGSTVEPPLPIVELDRFLAPVRRVLGYAARSSAVPRHVEATLGPWLDRCAGLAVPEAVRSLVEELRADLGSADVEALRASYQRVQRLDALLGLPLRRPPMERQRAGLIEVAAEPPPESPTEAEEGEASPSDERPPGEPPDLIAPVKGWDGHWGTPLGEAGLPAAIVAGLEAADLTTIGDLLWVPPVDVEVLRPVYGAGREIPEGRVAVGGRVVWRATMVTPEGRRVERIGLKGAGPLTVDFGDERIEDAEGWALDARVVVVGDYRDGVLYDPELVTDDGHKAVRLCRYGIDGVADRKVRALVRSLLGDLERVRDPLPPNLVRERLAFNKALEAVYLHGETDGPGRERFAFEEALFAQIGWSLTRFQRARDRVAAQPLIHQLSARLAQMFALTLSDPQQLALEDIKRDLRRPQAMLRLFTGDFGAGKGVVVLSAIAMVVEAKLEVLWITPDVVTAEARWIHAEPLLREVGVVARLYDGGQKGVVDGLRRGEIHVVFATAGQLEGLEFRRLGLVVVDEAEHQSGVVPLPESFKGPRPDTLVLAAVPAPTSSLWRIYPGHDVTELRGPTARGVRFELSRAASRLEAYQKVSEQLVETRRQALVVFPTRKATGADVLDAREAAQLLGALQAGAFQNHRVALYHGGMTREERQQVLEDFLHCRYEVLVATWPLDFAPTFPRLCAVIVEQAEHVSLQRLCRFRAQLEGSVATDPSMWFIVGDGADEAATERIRQVQEDRPERYFEDRPDPNPDPGAAMPELRWFDPRSHRGLLLEARRLSNEALREDLTLKRTPWGDLAGALRLRWDAIFGDEPCPIPSGGAQPSRRRRRRRRKK